MNFAQIVSLYVLCCENQSMQNLHIDEEGQQLHANPNKYIICKFV